MIKALRLALTGTALLAAPAAWAVPTTYNYTGSLQSFTAAETGNYVITAFGAQGGGNAQASGGLGAETAGTLFLSAGEVLSIIVGGSGNTSSGGGGSFVFTGSGATATALVVGGGGGGAGQFSAGLAGQATPSGGNSGSGNAGGTNGAGGTGASGANFAGGGGGGFFGPGSNGSVSATNFIGGGGGQAATAGGAGGAGGAAGANVFGSGGYGGGGGAGAAAGGGGGGYSGGGGGGINSGGGGGGSFLALDAFDATLLSGLQTGNGLVTIEEIIPPPTTVPEPASFAVLGLGVAGLFGWRHRQGG